MRPRLSLGMFAEFEDLLDFRQTFDLDGIEARLAPCRVRPSEAHVGSDRSPNVGRRQLFETQGPPSQCLPWTFDIVFRFRLSAPHCGSPPAKAQG